MQGSQQGLQRSDDLAKEAAARYIIHALDDSSPYQQREILSHTLGRLMAEMTVAQAEAFRDRFVSDPETLNNTRYRKRLVPGDITGFIRRRTEARWQLKQGGYFTQPQVLAFTRILDVELDQFTLANPDEGLYVFRK